MPFYCMFNVYQYRNILKQWWMHNVQNTIQHKHVNIKCSENYLPHNGCQYKLNNEENIWPTIVFQCLKKRFIIKICRDCKDNNTVFNEHFQRERKKKEMLIQAVLPSAGPQWKMQRQQWAEPWTEHCNIVDQTCPAPENMRNVEWGITSHYHIKHHIIMFLEKKISKVQRFHSIA